MNQSTSSAGRNNRKGRSMTASALVSLPASHLSFILSASWMVCWICWTLCVYLLEITVFGLQEIPVFMLGRPVLWILPALTGLAAACAFSQKSMIWKLAWSAAGALTACFLAFQALFSQPAALSQILHARDLVQQRAIQKDHPYLEGMIKLHQAAPLPVWIDEDVSVDEEFEAGIANLLTRLPEWLVQQTSALYFVDENEYRQTIDQKPNSLGLSAHNGRMIFVRVPEHAQSICLLNGRRFSSNEAGYYLETIVHELFHQAGTMQAGSVQFAWQQPEFENLYERYRNSLGEYAAGSPAEFFAEAGMAFVLYPQWTMRQMPDLAQWFAAYRPDVMPAFDRLK